MLTLSVTDINFDATTTHLRIKGKNIAENKHVKFGAFHTLEIELNESPFTITKEYWDRFSLESLDEACDLDKSADLAAVLMHEGILIEYLI